MTQCVANTTVLGEYGCGAEWNTYIGCIAALPPAAENWACSSPGFPPQPAFPACDPELTAVFNCLYYPTAP